jgi:3-hydroxy-9,10-secoandrosta-1,3,5(10)-triene-9,17-dione monooxygenase
LAPVLAARAAHGDQACRLPADTIADAREAGLFRVVQPKRWGGYEMDVGVLFDIQMALSEGDMSAGWVCGLLAMHPWQLAVLDDRAAQDVWGDDPQTLICSSLMPTGKAVPVDGGFRLSGRWKYSSGCHFAGWVYLGALIAGDPTASFANRTLVLVPRADFEIIETWDTPGLRGSGSHDIVVEDAFVPARRTQAFTDSFRGVGPGQAVNRAPLYRLPFGQIFCRGVSTPCIGGLQALLNAFLAYGASHMANGQKIAEDPAAQLACAETAAALDDMKTILHRNFRTLAEHAERGELPPTPLRLHYKFQSSITAERCSLLATRLFKVLGAAALSKDLPFQRIVADIAAARQHITNQYEIVGRNAGAALLGLDATKDLLI